MSGNFTEAYIRGEESVNTLDKSVFSKFLVFHADTCAALCVSFLFVIPALFLMLFSNVMCP